MAKAKMSRLKLLKFHHKAKKFTENSPKLGSANVFSEK